MLQVVHVAQAKMHKNILVVDDEADIREAVKDVLESCLDNASVQAVDSGAAALDFMSHAKVDLIVTDYKMPGMDGVQLLKAIESLSPGLPHILVTAFDRELLHDLGNQARGEHILQKPLDPERLLREVERALAR